MERHPNFVLMLSFKQMALRKLAITLFSEPRILASIARLQFKPGPNCCNIFATDQNSSGLSLNKKEWLRNVEDKMVKLKLPKSLTKQMKPLLKVIGSEIFAWKSIHKKYLRDSSEDFIVYVLQKLCWTTAGTVDYRKTAKELVCCNLVDVVKCFELACWYCLENYIPLLWKELPDENKKSFYDEDATSRVEIPHLQLFIPYILQKQSRIKTNYPMTVSNSFEKAALCGNKTLAEYSFWMLPEEERRTSLVRTAKNLILLRIPHYLCFDARKGKLTDILCFLLSLMTSEEQIKIFHELPFEVLSCFLDWPWQDLFLDIADAIFTFIPKSEYQCLGSAIYESIRNSGYYFPDIVQNLFLRSPVEFRKRFVHKEIKTGYFLFNFFNNEDTESIEGIFRNIEPADRVRLVSCKWSLNILYLGVEKWHMKEALLRAAMLCKEDKIRLKKDFIAFVRGHKPIPRNSIDLLREDCRRFFDFVDTDDVGAGNKRCLGDETLTVAKKLRFKGEEKCTE